MGITKINPKVFFTVLYALLLFTTAGFAQDNFRVHTVKQGETIYSIAKLYKVTEKGIYKLNPEAEIGISPNTKLIIPKAINQDDTEVTFKQHKVKKRENLVSISNKYNVSVADLKRYNPWLHSRDIKRKDKILIPVKSKPEITSTLPGSSSEDDNLGIHIIQPKETAFGVARKYGITISQLEVLNPDIKTAFNIGVTLKVPKESQLETAIIEPDFETYEVQPREGFYRLKIKLGLSKEEIVALNPYAEEGLRNGMILKIPRQRDEEAITVVNLEEGLVNFKPKNIVVLLPFELHKMDLDSVQYNEGLLRKSEVLRIALDFYKGVKIAAEFAKEKGISVNLQTFDTQRNIGRIQQIINANDFSEVDAVIGPLRRKQVEFVANALKRERVPVFSPLSKSEIRGQSNFFQTIPSKNILKKSMLDYLTEEGKDKKVMIISDAKYASHKAELLSVFPDAQSLSPREGGFLYPVDFENVFEKDEENWVVLESDNEKFVDNVVSLLNGIPEECPIRLFTLERNNAFDFSAISNESLGDLNFTFPSISKNYEISIENSFVEKYMDAYGSEPNNYAIRGFDITYDVLLRLASADNLYQAISGQTEYVDNKFNYTQDNSGGYFNNAHYILKLNKDLQYEIIKK